MSMKIFLTTFWAIFAAELADKTQFAGITLTADSGKPLSVWLGSVSAYMIITALSVMAGAILSKFLRPELIRYFSGGIFIAVGILILLNKL